MTDLLPSTLYSRMFRAIARARAVTACAAALSALIVAMLASFAAAQEVQVDTALVVSVDVSNSVDAERYRLQMEGIAKALEDSSVIDAITNGPNGAILFAMVTWADRPNFTLPWSRISSKEEALAVAQRVRTLPQQGGEFTCMTRMMRSVNDKVVSQIPAQATRVVLDVSGDGTDNCNAEEPIETVRDELVANGVTVNGLPIIVGPPDAPVGEGAYRAPGTGFEEAARSLNETSNGPTTLEQWFREHVMGGTGAFVLPANGYDDFGRAIRQKFVIEVSGMTPPARYAARANPGVAAPAGGARSTGTAQADDMAKDADAIRVR